MADSLCTATAPSAGIAIAAVATTQLVRAIRDRHDLSPVATAASGRLASGAVLLAAGLKGRERISLQIASDGPIGGLVADAWLTGERAIGARAYARNPHVDLPLNARGKFDVAAALGSGSLQVMKTHDVGRPYTGVVPLHSGEIAEDIAAYLARSEQIPSVVALGVLADPGGVVAAGGFVAQALPDADESAILELERRAGELPSVTHLIRRGADAAALVREVAGSLPLRGLRRLEVAFACLCSRQKVEAALIGLGAEDLQRMASERDYTEASCEYCRRSYVFGREELLKLSAR